MRTLRLAFGCSVILAVMVAPRDRAAGADASATPGFVAGETEPAGDGPFVKVSGGWMVPYNETIPGSDVTFRMIPVPGGTFRMGSPENEAGRTADEGPTFEVAVEPFWMGRCEVTWTEYKQYIAAHNLFLAMQAANIRTVDDSNEADAVTAPTALYDPSMTFMNGEEPEQPAVTMTQYAARQYTKWLSGLTGRFYRIPSESEWEYACRAGTDTPFSCGCGDPEALAEVAWFADNADDTTHPVGQKKPNAFGLHDMHGNVAEWVVDELVAGGYTKPATLPQPVAAETAIQWPVRLFPRVLRGGAYYDESTECRSASRKGSIDVSDDETDWKVADPNLPKSPWWYTEEPALGVGMRIVRPFATPADAAARARWWEADEQSIKDDVANRLKEGRATRGIVDPKLPAVLKKEGIWE
jgi:formylglycine-generating enzyme required for sulfatase activity